MAFTRRNLLAAAGAAVPAMLAGGSARAWTETRMSLAAAGMAPPTGLWQVLEHVTDGTNPSLLVMDEAPRITPEIRALAGTAVELTGWLQPAATTGLAEQGHVLSRLPMHCPFCYQAGRGSLALVEPDAAAPLTAEGRVTIAGTLHLQESDPSDFYFVLHNARLTAA